MLMVYEVFIKIYYQPMKNSFSHSGIIHYNLDVSFHFNVLELNLTITKNTGTTKFKHFLTDDSFSMEMKKELKTVSNLFVFLEKKENFVVDPLKGVLLLNLKEEGENLEIKLKEMEDKEEDAESSVFSEFGGEIEQLEFP